MSAPASAARTRPRRSKRTIRATSFGGSPTSSRKRAIRRRWLQPSSRTSSPMGAVAAAPPQAPERPGDARVEGRRVGQAGRQGPVDQREPVGPARRRGHALDQLGGRPPEHVLEGDRPVGQLAHRQAQQATRRQRREVDLQAAGRPGVLHHHRPVGEAGDERAEPLGGGLGPAGVGDRPAGVEVDDDRHVGARQLAEPHRRGRPLGIARVAEDGPGKGGVRRAPDELGAHPGHA